MASQGGGGQGAGTGDRLSLALLLGASLTLAAGTFIPQRSITGSQGLAGLQGRVPGLAAWVRRLALDRIFESGWLTALSLALAGLLAWESLARWRTWNSGGRRAALGFLFHQSLFALFLLIAAARLTGYEGQILLTEGQVVPEREESYLSIQKRRFLSGPSGQTVEFLRLEPDLVLGGASRGPAVHLLWRGEKGESRQEILYANHPGRAGGRKLYFTRAGFAPVLLAADAKGSVLVQAALSLNWKEGEEASREVYPHLAAGTGTALDGPVTVEYGAVPGKSGFAVPSPQTLLRLAWSGGKAVLPLGGEALVQGLRLSFPERRAWIYLRVVREPFAPWAVACAALALALFGAKALAPRP